MLIVKIKENVTGLFIKMFIKFLSLVFFLRKLFYLIKYFIPLLVNVKFIILFTL